MTANPYAQWTAQQIINAFPYQDAPRFLIRDRDGIYGDYITKRIESMGIEEVPSPHKVQAAMKLVPQRMAEQPPPLVSSDVSTFELTALLAESLQAAAIRGARRAANRSHQPNTVVS